MQGMLSQTHFIVTEDPEDNHKIPLVSDFWFGIRITTDTDLPDCLAVWVGEDEAWIVGDDQIAAFFASFKGHLRVEYSPEDANA